MGKKRWIRVVLEVPTVSILDTFGSRLRSWVKQTYWYLEVIRALVPYVEINGVQILRLLIFFKCFN